MAQAPPLEMSEAPPREMAEAPPREMAEASPREMVEAPPREMTEASPCEMAEAPPLEMAQAPAPIPRIIHDMERNLYRIAYGFVYSHGVEESDSYLKQIANEIYIYLRQTQTYDPQGETTNSEVDKSKQYEHVAGTDEGLDAGM